MLLTKKYYERLNKELFEKHSLAAFVIYVDIGEEFNFKYNEILYSVTIIDDNRFLSSPNLEETQLFKDTTDLVIHATIEGKPFIDVWDKIEFC